MKKPRFFRILALMLCLSLVLTGTLAAAAASIVSDINGDGRVSAFDAQIIAEAAAGDRTLTDQQAQLAEKTTLQTVMDYLFGRVTVDAGDLDGDGVMEIYSIDGLLHMAENPSRSYILMNDLDLGGAEWTPIAGFSGSFDGNGHTISNLTISQNTGINQGFFGDTTKDSVVTDLALRKVTLTAAENAQFIGLIAGTSRGTMTGFTATGVIRDSRTVMPNGTDKIFVGALFGRTVEASGAHTGGTGITVIDNTGNYTVGDLCADVKIYIEKSSKMVIHNGLVGYLYDGTSVTGIWSDSSTDSSGHSIAMQLRQQAAVDYMNAMATVAWEVPETLTYNASGAHYQQFVPGTVYYGLPYNGRTGSLERFMSVVESTTDGVHMIQSGLGDSDKLSGDPITGFAVYMGNDCSGAVAQAWSRISPTRVSSGYKSVGGQIVEKSPNEYAGGAHVNVTKYMVPALIPLTISVKDESGNTVSGTITYRQRYGIYPVGDWTTNGSGVANADDVVGTFAYDTEAVDGLSADSMNTNLVARDMGDQVMAEAYAMTRKADALVYAKPNGHARLVVADPVVIRESDGTIDLHQSFLVCTEQGDGLYDATNSSWRVNHRWSFYNLLGYDDPTLPEDYEYSKGAYLPITIRALRAEYVKYAYVDEAVAVTGPATGRTYSNWRTLKSTVIVKDGAGTELFRHEAYAGLEGDNGNYDYCRGEGQTVELSYAHGEAFEAFAKENLTEGQTYYYSVQLHLSNGETKVINRDSLNADEYGHSGTEFDPFVYTPAE